jgi:hypothetical protein
MKSAIDYIGILGTVRKNKIKNKRLDLQTSTDHICYRATPNLNITVINIRATLKLIKTEKFDPCNNKLNKIKFVVPDKL